MADSFLKQKRILKGKLTRFTSQIDNILSNPSEFNIISDLEFYQNEVNALSDDINKLTTDILTACSDSDFEKYEQEMHEVLSKLDTLKITMKRELKNETKLTQNNSDTQQNNAECGVKLPHVELPIFTSNYNDWLSFHDLFLASVGNNTSLSNCQKLQYLKLSVKGEAATLIQSIQITNENYQKAWDLLVSRFENKTEIINAALTRLITQPTLKHESAFALRKLIDTTSQCIDTLNILKQPVQHWDTIIIFILKGKLDPETLRVWTLNQTPDKIPTLEEFRTYILNRAQALASLKPRETHKSEYSKEKTNKYHFPAASAQRMISNVCYFCKGDSHIGLYQCNEFRQLPVKEKWEVIKKKRLCPNCLKSNISHSLKNCKSGLCRNCSQPHNTILCSKIPEHETTHAELESQLPTVSSNNSAIESKHDCVLLPTAVVYASGSNGALYKCRLLIDSGSQGSFITERCVNLLGLKRTNSNIHVDGLSAQRVGKVTGLVNVNLTSLFYQNSTIHTEAFILKKITCDLPQFIIKSNELSEFQNINLADPNCFHPGRIDILIGADLFGKIMLNGRLTNTNHSLTALESIFGWIIIGRAKSNSTKPNSIQSNHTICNDTEYQLDKFWQIEEISDPKPYTSEETKCEEHFQKTVSRDSSGRFTVKFPFRDTKANLGSSRDLAVHRLLQTERRFVKNESLSVQYKKFMNEYIELGHMEQIPENEVEVPVNSCYYLPHHPVPNKTGDKFRVVFDGSAKTSTGVSLNNQLMVGPKLQDDLATLLVRFRKNRIAVTADIEKMYRQVILQDSDFQRIVWRESPLLPIKDYRLTRIAYGTASAPYLAVKCLQQLASEVTDLFPLASHAVRKDFYVDDLMSGANSLSEALELKNQLNQALSSAGFHLRKWSSNSQEFLSTINEKSLSASTSLDIENETKKTLGIYWNATEDVFLFKVNPSPKGHLTKRLLLSAIARTFDPLGWISPVTIQFKILLQKLWKIQLRWDESIPPDITEEWFQLSKDMELFVNAIKFPRFLSSNHPCLFGFCDASEKAYAAVIYHRSIQNDGEFNVQLVISKTKVAPLKTLSIPRLELCGALLLVKLMAFTCTALNIPMSETHLFTDSTIVLSWLASHANKWKTFVANRVAKIQRLSSSDQWHHVSGDINPADVASRGVSSAGLPASWFTGPEFLMHPTVFQTESFPIPEIVPEQKQCTVSTNFVTNHENSNKLFLKYSSLSKLKRITAYCLRFIHNCKTFNDKTTGFLKPSEIENALNVLVKIVQNVEFNNEITALQKCQALNYKSKIVNLNPFLDDSGLLRVGGRLRHAKIPYARKHQILLPKKHPLTNLIVKYYHVINLHGGAQLVQTAIQEKFWIVGGRDLIRYLIRKCVKCFKFKTSITNQLMSDLPVSRISPAPTFSRCGVDYAGPFQLKVSKGRSSKTFKAYIALFVCFVTRAVHLELVSDLSTEAFLAALKRFIARRGKCNDIYSDCGTNFVGAKRQLAEFRKLSISKDYNNKVSDLLSDMGINWHLNVPGAPHMGGLWEAGIKSTKYHLKRVVGDVKLTFEEFQTLLTQIEACLNSRPLTALSSDPNDLEALTPGHFLIGRALNSISEPDYTNSNVSYLTRWQLVQKLVQQFWKRWHSEYLSRLQQRPKWLLPSKNLEINDLCLLRDDNLPPTKWKLCRVIKLHPGADSNVRVVTIKTAESVLKRNIAKLCLLPI